MEHVMRDSDIERVWRLMEEVRVCMLSTWEGRRIHSRPMCAFPRREEDVIYFFSEDGARKNEEISRHPKVSLTFADTRGQKYVALSGMAQVASDRAKMRELWRAGEKIWWETLITRMSACCGSYRRRPNFGTRQAP
jgi:general stress protein 26